MLGLGACKGMGLSVSQRGAETVSPVWFSPIWVQNVQTPSSLDISQESDSLAPWEEYLFIMLWWWCRCRTIAAEFLSERNGQSQHTIHAIGPLPH